MRQFKSAKYTLGYSLIELSAAIAVTGIISSVAIPKMIELDVLAEKASVQHVASQFQSAVNLANASYFAKGFKNISIADLRMWGLDEKEGLIDFNQYGYPVKHELGAIGESFANSGHCVSLWKSLLKSNLIISRNKDDEADYFAELTNSKCKYHYNSASNFSFSYDPVKGVVSFNP